VADRVALFERLAGRLIKTAAAGGAVIVVDDIHWADEPSLVALLHVVRTVRRARLLVCVAERPGGSDSTDGWRGVRSSLMREPHAHLMEVHGLSQAGSAELLHELLGGRVPEQLVSHAYAVSAGNPFYLREVVRALDRVAASDVELPATLAGVVEQRLEQLTPRTRELLRASSILGEEFSIAIAARLLGRSVFGCLPDIDEAISAGALSAAAGDRVRFTHALVRAALGSGLSLRAQVRLHGRAVRAIEQLYADSCPAISPTLRDTLPPPRWAVIDDRPRSGHAAPGRGGARWRSRKRRAVRICARDRRRFPLRCRTRAVACGPRCGRAPLRPTRHGARHLRRGHPHRASNS
jgi:predicted ATPase